MELELPSLPTIGGSPAYTGRTVDQETNGTANHSNMNGNTSLMHGSHGAGSPLGLRNSPLGGFGSGGSIASSKGEEDAEEDEFASEVKNITDTQIKLEQLVTHTTTTTMADSGGLGPFQHSASLISSGIDFNMVSAGSGQPPFQLNMADMQTKLATLQQQQVMVQQQQHAMYLQQIEQQTRHNQQVLAQQQFGANILPHQPQPSSLPFQTANTFSPSSSITDPTMPRLQSPLGHRKPLTISATFNNSIASTASNSINSTTMNEPSSANTTGTNTPSRKRDRSGSFSQQQQQQQHIHLERPFSAAAAYRTDLDNRSQAEYHRLQQRSTSKPSAVAEGGHHLDEDELLQQMKRCRSASPPISSSSTNSHALFQHQQFLNDLHKPLNHTKEKSPTTTTTAPSTTTNNLPHGVNASGRPQHHHRRRKTEELLPHEKWLCPYKNMETGQGCGKMYRTSSSRSISKHVAQCQHRPIDAPAIDHLPPGQTNAMMGNGYRENTSLQAILAESKRKQKTRRKSSELAPHERWNCPFQCGQFFRSTSTKSIHKHRQICPKRSDASPEELAAANVPLEHSGMDYELSAKERIRRRSSTVPGTIDEIMSENHVTGSGHGGSGFSDESDESGGSDSEEDSESQDEDGGHGHGKPNSQPVIDSHGRRRSFGDALLLDTQIVSDHHSHHPILIPPRLDHQVNLDGEFGGRRNSSTSSGIGLPNMPTAIQSQQHHLAHVDEANSPDSVSSTHQMMDRLQQENEVKEKLAQVAEQQSQLSKLEALSRQQAAEFKQQQAAAIAAMQAQQLGGGQMTSPSIPHGQLPSDPEQVAKIQHMLNLAMQAKLAQGDLGEHKSNSPLPHANAMDFANQQQSQLQQQLDDLRRMKEAQAQVQHAIQMVQQGSATTQQHQLNNLHLQQQHQRQQLLQQQAMGGFSDQQMMLQQQQLQQQHQQQQHDFRMQEQQQLFQLQQQQQQQQQQQLHQLSVGGANVLMDPNGNGPPPEDTAAFLRMLLQKKEHENQLLLQQSHRLHVQQMSQQQQHQQLIAQQQGRIFDPIQHQQQLQQQQHDLLVRPDSSASMRELSSDLSNMNWHQQQQQQMPNPLQSAPFMAPHGLPFSQHPQAPMNPFAMPPGAFQDVHFPTPNLAHPPLMPSTRPPATARSSTGPKKMMKSRRVGSQLPQHERWTCPLKCGKFYKKSSSNSIKRHALECLTLLHSKSIPITPVTAQELAHMVISGVDRSGRKRPQNNQSNQQQSSQGQNSNHMNHPATNGHPSHDPSHSSATSIPSTTGLPLALDELSYDDVDDGDEGGDLMDEEEEGEDGEDEDDDNGGGHGQQAEMHMM